MLLGDDLVYLGDVSPDVAVHEALRQLVARTIIRSVFWQLDHRIARSSVQVFFSIGS